MSKILDLDNLNNLEIISLQKGDIIKISGKILTARDATCLKIFSDKNSQLDFKNKFIYFSGPSPTPKGKKIGSCGPTTTSRMQSYFEDFFKMGVKGFIGKGEIDKKYFPLFKKHQGILLNVSGGIGALLAKKVKSSSVKAYKELGPEAVWEFEVEDFPTVLVVDSNGESIFS